MLEWTFNLLVNTVSARKSTNIYLQKKLKVLNTGLGAFLLFVNGSQHGDGELQLATNSANNT